MNFIVLICMVLSFSVEKDLHKEVRFLGFSENGKIGAWQVDYSKTSGFLYSLIRVVKVQTIEEIAIFRNSPTTPTALLDLDFVNAQSKRIWLKFRHQAHLSFQTVPLNEGTLRLLLDDDSKTSVVSGKAKISVLGDIGSSLSTERRGTLK